MKVVINVLRGIIGVILCAVIVVNGWLLIDQLVFHHQPPAILGYSQLVVGSGSMSPTLEAGDLILVNPASDYTLGDVVTFRDENGTFITHRLVGTVEEDFITKGDANQVEDDTLLAKENILGRVVFSIPQGGKAILFLQSPLGLLLVIVIGFVLIELPVLLGGREKEKTGGKHARS